MPIGLVHPNNTLKYCDQDIVHSFNLAVGLRVIWVRVIVAQVQCRCQLNHHVISEMVAMVCDNGLGYVEPRNNMVEKELSYRLTVCRVCRHRFGPFGEVIHNNDNIAMPPGRTRATCHIIDAPFGKRTNSNDEV